MVDREMMQRDERAMYFDPKQESARLTAREHEVAAINSRFHKLLPDRPLACEMEHRAWSTPVRMIGAVLIAFMLFATSARAQNFTVSGGSQAFNQQVADAAETYRRELAIHWLGKELPRWAAPCPITVKPGNVGAGGATSFIFDHGEVFGWSMTMQGTPERIVDSVLPHEITHTIFASHFRRAVPRWADEGACTTVEHASERRRMHDMLHEFLRTNRGIAFNDMFAMKQYPDDVLPLYSQGHSLSRFLLEHAGPRDFIAFLEAGMVNETREGWQAAVKASYGYRNLGELQTTWLDWVAKGSPASGQVVGYQPCSGGHCNPMAGGGAQMMHPRQSFAGGRWSAVNDGSDRQPTLSVAPPVRPQDRVDIDDLQPLPSNVGPVEVPTQTVTATPAAQAASTPCDNSTLVALINDLKAKVDELAKRPPAEPGPPGATGAKGDKGDKGDAGPSIELTEIEINQIAASVRQQLPPAFTRAEATEVLNEALGNLKPFDVEIVDEQGRTISHQTIALGGKVKLRLREKNRVVK